jgi:hypothetical protein
MNELVAVVAESLGGQECVQVEKFPDGMFNKALYDITKRLLSQAKNELSDQMGYSNSEKAVWNKLWRFDN